MKETKKPKTKRRIKTYELYEGYNGITPMSIHYGECSKDIYRVKAYTCRQARYLANNKIYINDNSEVGIIEIVP